MLIFTEPHLVNVSDSVIMVYNLSSLKEGFEKINILPPFLRNFQDENQFDSEYAKYLIQDDLAFYEMYKIILGLYYGYDVYIMVSHGIVQDILTESLQRFLRFRYGILSYNINQMEDYDGLQNVGSQFTVLGIQAADLDRNRYLIMYATFHPESLVEQE